MSLCPEAEYRASLSDDDFWAHVFRRQIGNDEDGPDDRDLTSYQADPCPVCGEIGACGYDAEGRDLIHVVSEEAT